MNSFAAHWDGLTDKRQSPAARDIGRGVGRLFRGYGWAPVSEVTLANGRRADLIGLSEAGDIWIVEIKSCLEDFRLDQKWPEYRDYCDGFFFAVAPTFPREVLPLHTGLIVADWRERRQCAGRRPLIPTTAWKCWPKPEATSTLLRCPQTPTASAGGGVA
jgi:hypothetical protein